MNPKKILLDKDELDELIAIKSFHRWELDELKMKQSEVMIQIYDRIRTRHGLEKSIIHVCGDSVFYVHDPTPKEVNAFADIVSGRSWLK